MSVVREKDVPGQQPAASLDKRFPPRTSSGRGYRRKALLLPLILLGALAFRLLALGPVPSASGHHVVVISVDGMGSSFYMAPPAGLRIPSIRRLMKEGAFAEAVQGVYPTLTYPSHTTLVTGCLPAEHGIYTNLSSREPGKNPKDWFWFSRSIKVPTLWDEARQHGLSTASIAWPVTGGAPIDWDIPEIWDPRRPPAADPLYLARFMKPLLGVELLGAVGLPRPDVDDDSFKTRLAVYLIQEHSPSLLLIHFTDLDQTEHDVGPQSPEAAAELDRLDAHIGEILAALKGAGLAASTDVFVVSDHGFRPIEREIRPNVLLVKAGLLTADADGNVIGGKIATVANGGSFFIYLPKDGAEDLLHEVDTALKPLRDQGLAGAVLDHAALNRLSADPDAQLALDAPEGASFSDDTSGDLVGRLPTTEGTHGGMSSSRGLESSFIAWGPGIKAGVDLHGIPMTRIGPTILKAMRINDPKFGDGPPIHEIFRLSGEQFSEGGGMDHGGGE